MTITRRSLLRYAALLPAGCADASCRAAESLKADYTLRIATGLVESRPEHIVSTTLYNGQFPGPLLRFKEGERVVVDIYNDTDTPELVHWHGQMIPSEVDGASEEGTPFIAATRHAPPFFRAEAVGFSLLSHPCGRRRRSEPRYLHGPSGPVYIEPKNNPGAYDREMFLVHEGIRALLQPRRGHGHGFSRRRSDQGIAADGQTRRRGGQRQDQRIRSRLQAVRHQRQNALASAIRSGSSRASASCSMY